VVQHRECGDKEGKIAPHAKRRFEVETDSRNCEEMELVELREQMSCRSSPYRIETNIPIKISNIKVQDDYRWRRTALWIIKRNREMSDSVNRYRNVVYGLYKSAKGKNQCGDLQA
jgi:hypothetical protein